MFHNSTAWTEHLRYLFSDNLIHDNKEVINSTVESGCCLYTVSGNTCYPMHDFYRWVTACIVNLAQWTLNIPGRITPMIESMIGWSWRAGKSNFKRTEESSKEWAFFYKLANIGKKFMLFAEMNQYFRVRQDFLFSSNCFTSICSKKVSIFTFIFWKNYKCFDLSKKPLPFN